MRNLTQMKHGMKLDWQPVLLSPDYAKTFVLAGKLSCRSFKKIVKHLSSLSLLIVLKLSFSMIILRFMWCYISYNFFPLQLAVCYDK